MSIVARRRAGAVCVVLALVAAVWPSVASAQNTRFVRLGGGLAFSRGARVDATTHFPDAQASRAIDYDAGLHAALRAGVWHQPGNRVGVAVDAAYQRHEGDGVRFDHISASLLVMARRMLANGLDGQVAVGPVAVFTFADINFQPDLPRAFDGGGTALGVDARVGVTRRLTDRTFADGEYRYVHHDVDIETQTAEYLLGLPARPKERVRSTTDSHTLAISIGFRF